MDLYINTTLKNFFGFPETYQINFYEINNKMQCILQSSLPKSNLSKLLIPMVNEFKQYIMFIIKQQYPIIRDDNILLLEDKIIIEFNSYDIKQSIDDYIENLKIMKYIEYKPAIINGGMIIDYNYEVRFMFDIKNLSGMKFEMEQYQLRLKLLDSLKNYIPTLFTDDAYAFNMKMKMNGKIYIDLNIIFSISLKSLKSQMEYYNNIILTNLYSNKSRLDGMTREQIIYSPFVYLQHITILSSFEKILKYRRLENKLNLGRQGIEVEENLFAKSENRENVVVKSAYNLQSFPGIYTSLVTQYDLFKNELHISNEDIILVLSLSLLQQQNWHLNLRARYGIITNETFSPHNLALYLHLLKPFWGDYDNDEEFDRELIIHDEIPIELIECILVNNENSLGTIQSLLIKYDLERPVYINTRELRKEFVSKQFIRHDDEYLNENLPQLCYSNIAGDEVDEKNINEYVFNFYNINPYTLEEIQLTNDEELKEKEYMWNKMLENCGIDEIYHPDRAVELYHKIEDRMQSLYFGNGKRLPPANLPPFKYTPEYYQRTYE